MIGAGGLRSPKAGAGCAKKMGKKVNTKKAEKRPKVEDGALMIRHRTIIPCLEICRDNCLNFDPYQKCPIFLRGRICSSWRPRDLGDTEVPEEEQAPYTWETALGGAEVKHSGRSIGPPVDEVDAEDVGEEEEAEVE